MQVLRRFAAARHTGSLVRVVATDSGDKGQFYVLSADDRGEVRVWQGNSGKGGEYRHIGVLYKPHSGAMEAAYIAATQDLTWTALSQGGCLHLIPDLLSQWKGNQPFPRPDCSKNDPVASLDRAKRIVGQDPPRISYTTTASGPVAITGSGDHQALAVAEGPRRVAIYGLSLPGDGIKRVHTVDPNPWGDSDIPALALHSDSLYVAIDDHVEVWQFNLSLKRKPSCRSWIDLAPPREKLSEAEIRQRFGEEALKQQQNWEEDVRKLFADSADREVPNVVLRIRDCPTEKTLIASNREVTAMAVRPTSGEIADSSMVDMVFATSDGHVAIVPKLSKHNPEIYSRKKNLSLTESGVVGVAWDIWSPPPVIKPQGQLTYPAAWVFRPLVAYATTKNPRLTMCAKQDDEPNAIRVGEIVGLDLGRRKVAGSNRSGALDVAITAKTTRRADSKRTTSVYLVSELYDAGRQTPESGRFNVVQKLDLPTSLPFETAILKDDEVIVGGAEDLVRWSLGSQLQPMVIGRIRQPDHSTTIPNGTTPSAIVAAGFTPDGDRIVVADLVGRVLYIDLHQRRVIDSLQLSADSVYGPGQVRSIEVNAASPHVLITRDRGPPLLWEYTEAGRTTRPQTPKSLVEGVDGGVLVPADFNRQRRVWELAPSKTCPAGRDDQVLAGTFHHDRRHVIVGTRGNYVYAFKVPASTKDVWSGTRKLSPLGDPLQCLNVGASNTFGQGAIHGLASMPMPGCEANELCFAALRTPEGLKEQPTALFGNLKTGRLEEREARRSEHVRDIGGFVQAPGDGDHAEHWRLASIWPQPRLEHLHTRVVAFPMNHTGIAKFRTIAQLVAALNDGNTVERFFESRSHIELRQSITDSQSGRAFPNENRFGLGRGPIMDMRVSRDKETNATWLAVARPRHISYYDPVSCLEKAHVPLARDLTQPTSPYGVITQLAVSPDTRFALAGTSAGYLLLLWTADALTYTPELLEPNGGVRP